MPVTINGTTGIVSPNYTGNGSVPTGSVYHFASSTAPTGFLICNGDAVPNGSGTVQGVTTDFSELYTILGTTYGAAGTLPDLRGIFLRGSGSQTISGRSYSAAFANKQPMEVQAHSAEPVLIASVTGGPTQIFAYNGTIDNQALTSTSSETRPANIALLPCIKY